MKNPNPIIIQKDTSPYMYLTEYSGIFLNDYDSENLFRGIAIDINETQSNKHYLVSLQLWIRFPEQEFSTTSKIFSIISETSNIDFQCIPLSNNKKARITTTSSVRMYKNGNRVPSLIINSGEWYSIYIIFDDPINFDNFKGKLILYPNFVYNNIAQYVYENSISTITTGMLTTWMNILNGPNETLYSWQNALDQGTWNDIQYESVIQNDYIVLGDYIYNNQIGTSVIINDDSSAIIPYSNGIDIYANIEWQKFEKRII